MCQDVVGYDQNVETVTVERTDKASGRRVGGIQREPKATVLHRCTDGAGSSWSSTIQSDRVLRYRSHGPFS